MPYPKNIQMKNLYIPLTPEEEQFPFGRWQYRQIGGWWWTDAIKGQRPVYSVSLYKKRGNIFSYAMLNKDGSGIEWRWMR